jgi:uncharacterized surface protein with fasciclin (FAS1) repeats
VLGFGVTITSAADIVDRAVGGNFNTLVAAVKAAGLVDMLKGPARVTKTDIATTNGMIHVIDTVLLPK